MIDCGLCGIELRSIRSLSKHIRDRHQCNSKEYYDRFIQQGSAMCCVCDSEEVMFVNLSLGYKRTCSHKCGAKLHRQNLAADAEKNNAFREKVAANQSRIWKDREESGEAEEIRKRISQTISDNISLLTPEERSERFGWLNKLTEEEKKSWIHTVMLNTGAFLWWKNASEEEKNLVRDRQTATRMGISEHEYVRPVLDDKELYYRLVNTYTEMTYTQHKELLDPNGRRGQGFHLDHRFSKAMGFQNNISPEIIGSVVNLELIPEFDNMSKGAKCSITEDVLMESYYEQK